MELNSYKIIYWVEKNSYLSLPATGYQDSWFRSPLKIDRLRFVCQLATFPTICVRYGEYCICWRWLQSSSPTLEVKRQITYRLRDLSISYLSMTNVRTKAQNIRSGVLQRKKVDQVFTKTRRSLSKFFKLIAEIPSNGHVTSLWKPRSRSNIYQNWLKHSLLLNRLRYHDVGGNQ